MKCLSVLVLYCSSAVELHCGIPIGVAQNVHRDVHTHDASLRKGDLITGLSILTRSPVGTRRRGSA